VGCVSGNSVTRRTASAALHVSALLHLGALKDSGLTPAGGGHAVAPSVPSADPYWIRLVTSRTEVAALNAQDAAGRLSPAFLTTSNAGRAVEIESK